MATIWQQIRLLAGYLYRAWMKLGQAMGWVNGRILLTLTFFVLLTPIALLMRLFRRDPLQLKFPGKESLFKKRDHLYEARDFENPW